MASSLIITCKQATLMVVQQKDIKFSLKQRFALWFHMQVCKICKLFAAQNEVIDKVLAQKHNSNKLTEPEKDKLRSNFKA